MTTILVVEDNTGLRENLVDTLELKGFDVLSAVNGYEGIELASSKLPDLIISDVMMPEIDGYKMLEILRQNMKTALIPVIFLTARASEEDRRHGMLLGADDYLTKPFKDSDLFAAIQSRLALQAKQELSRLRSMAQELVKVQEQERQDIAHHLQNKIMQGISGLKIGLNTLDTEYSGEQLAVTIESLRDLLAEVSQQIESTIFNLYPIVLDHLGLLPSLLWQIELYRNQGYKIDFQHQNIPKTLSPALALSCFRIIQDALKISLEQAKAQAILLRLWLEDDALNILLESDKDIFSQLSNDGQNLSYGIWALRERALALGGDLSLSKSEEKRASLYARLPLQAASFAPMPKASLLTFSESRNDKVDTPMSEDVSIKVMLIHENALVTQGLKDFINRAANQELVGTSDTYSNGLTMLADLKPDVLILEYRMSDEGSLSFIESVRGHFPTLGILVISNYPQEIYVVGALQAGADGYILSDARPEEIIDAIQMIHAGGRYIASSISAEKVEEFLSNASGDEALTQYYNLTEREREIFKLIAEGLSNAEIAEALVISRRTVESHRASVIHKLGFRTKVDLLRYAVKFGLIQLNE